MKKLNVSLKNEFLDLFSQKKEKDLSSFSEKSNYYSKMTDILYRIFKENIVIAFDLSCAGSEKDEEKLKLLSALYSEKEQIFLGNIDTLTMTLCYDLHYESKESIELLNDIENCYNEGFDFKFLKEIFEKY